MAIYDGVISNIVSLITQMFKPATTSDYGFMSPEDKTKLNHLSNSPIYNVICSSEGSMRQKKSAFNVAKSSQLTDGDFVCVNYQNTNTYKTTGADDDLITLTIDDIEYRIVADNNFSIVADEAPYLYGGANQFVLYMVKSNNMKQNFLFYIYSTAGSGSMVSDDDFADALSKIDDALSDISGNLEASI